MSPNLRTIQALWKRWRAPAIGMAIGLTYGIASEIIGAEATHAPKIFFWIDDFVSVVLPVIFGWLAGLAYNHVRWQARINRTLSTVNAQLQRHLLTQTLSAHILHEIRNPMHNLTAVLEGWQERLPSEEVSILQRNLSRLYAVTNQLSRWTASDDEINLREPIRLDAWLDEFVSDKVRPRLHETDVTLVQEIRPVVVEMHPLLLEQCFIPLFNNALEAVVRGHEPPTIHLAVRSNPDHEGYVEVQLRNTGRRYPDTVLAVQGREPVNSQHGLGLGLVLIRRSLELAGGTIQFANADRQAITTLWIPGHPA